MKITEEDKIIIKNDYLEFGLNANQIWKNQKAKNWDRVSVWRDKEEIRRALRQFIPRLKAAVQ